MMRPGMMSGPFGSEQLVPTPPRGPHRGRWKFIVLAIVLALGLAAAIGGPALAHSVGMAGGCGGGGG
jgi:hypothetical protein